MKIAVCHLSDIHLKSGVNPILARVGKISDAMNTVDGDIKTCFVVLTGDMAFSGKASEYVHGLSLLAQLQSGLLRKFSEVYLVLVPGNHDCDFETAEGNRKLLLRSVNESESDIDQSVIAVCASVQENFFNLRDAACDKALPKGDRLFYEYSFVLPDGYSLVFRCFNSAWISEKKERQGQLFLPLEMLPRYEPSSEKSIVMSVFHHTYPWLKADNARGFRKYIEENSDMVLTGHEHDQVSYTVKKTSGETSGYFEGGVLQDHDKKGLSNFNVLLIDLDRKEMKLSQLSWEKDCYAPEQEGEWVEFEKNRVLRRNLFGNTRQFYEYLTDLGTGFTHPRKAKPTLLDFFVYPDLVDTNLIKKSGKAVKTEFPRIHGDSVVATVTEQKKVLIVGDGKSGKTSLAKMLYLDVKEMGIVPVMIQGSRIKHPNQTSFSGEIQEAFQRQYLSELYTKYTQLDKTMKMLIVEDFHNCPLNQEGRRKIVELADGSFSIIAIFGDQFTSIQDMVSREKNQPSCFVNFKHLQIHELGNLLRNTLIEKWLVLGQEHLLNEQQLGDKVAKTAKMIKVILGKDLVPSYPVFVLILLQAFEAGKTLDESAGAFGFFYEFLIREALAHGDGEFDSDTKFTYLSLLAFRMLTQKRLSVDAEEIKEITGEYERTYREISHHVMVAELLSSGVILEHDDEKTFSFRYRYFFYYFVATYLAKNITKEEIRTTVKNLISRIYLEDCAYIVIFLTYLSKDPFILEEMMGVSKQIFPEIPPVDVIAATQAVDNHFGREPVKLAFHEKFLDGKSNREALLKATDEYEEIEKNKSDPAEHQVLEDEATEGARLAVELNRALKSIQVLGQIVKNFPGSTEKKDKIAIVEECYSLGMRTLGQLLKLIEGREDELINEIADALAKSNPRAEREALMNGARAFVFTILELSTFGIMKRVSHSVGSDKLLDVYKIVKENSTNSSFSFIDLAIKLDHMGSFPIKDFRDLRSAAKGKVFPEVLLQILSVEYLYNSLIPAELKQKILALAGIPLTKGKLIPKRDLKFGN